MESGRVKPQGSRVRVKHGLFPQSQSLVSHVLLANFCSAPHNHIFLIPISPPCVSISDHGVQPSEVYDERHVSSRRGFAAIHGARAPRKGECVNSYVQSDGLALVFSDGRHDA